MAAFSRYLHSQLARSGVDILKNPFVDSLQVTSVEYAWHRSVDQLGDSPGGGFRFKLSEDASIAYRAEVSKDACSGVRVWVRALGHAKP